MLGTTVLIWSGPAILVIGRFMNGLTPPPMLNKPRVRMEMQEATPSWGPEALLSTPSFPARSRYGRAKACSCDSRHLTLSITRYLIIRRQLLRRVTSGGYSRRTTHASYRRRSNTSFDRCVV